MYVHTLWRLQFPIITRIMKGFTTFSFENKMARNNDFANIKSRNYYTYDTAL